MTQPTTTPEMVEQNRTDIGTTEHRRDSEMVERVARAIADDEVNWLDYVGKARAAIAAMREFTMIYRVNGEAVHELRGAPDDIWKACIDAALQDDAA